MDAGCACQPECPLSTGPGPPFIGCAAIRIAVALWHREGSYRAGLTGHHPSLQWRRIEEACKVIIRRIDEIEDDCDERHKQDNAIEALNRLRNR